MLNKQNKITDIRLLGDFKTTMSKIAAVGIFTASQCSGWPYFSCQVLHYFTALLYSGMPWKNCLYLLPFLLFLFFGGSTQIRLPLEFHPNGWSQGPLWTQFNNEFSGPDKWYLSLPFLLLAPGKLLLVVCRRHAVLSQVSRLGPYPHVLFFNPQSSNNNTHVKDLDIW